eukprot:PhF_6_TR10349/c0_g1_i6/m.15976
MNHYHNNHNVFAVIILTYVALFSLFSSSSSNSFTCHAAAASPTKMLNFTATQNKSFTWSPLASISWNAYLVNKVIQRVVENISFSGMYMRVQPSQCAMVSFNGIDRSSPSFLNTSRLALFSPAAEVNTLDVKLLPNVLDVPDATLEDVFNAISITFDSQCKQRSWNVTWHAEYYGQSYCPSRKTYMYLSKAKGTFDDFAIPCKAGQCGRPGLVTYTQYEGGCLYESLSSYRSVLSVYGQGQDDLACVTQVAASSEHYWVCGRGDGNGTWLWQCGPDAGTVINTFYWASGEPKVLDGCIAVRSTLWYSVSCNSSFQALCEQQIRKFAYEGNISIEAVYDETTVAPTPNATSEPIIITEKPVPRVGRIISSPSKVQPVQSSSIKEQFTKDPVTAVTMIVSGGSPDSGTTQLLLASLNCEVGGVLRLTFTLHPTQLELGSNPNFSSAIGVVVGNIALVFAVCVIQLGLAVIAQMRQASSSADGEEYQKLPFIQLCGVVRCPLFTLYAEMYFRQSIMFGLFVLVFHAQDDILICLFAIVVFCVYVVVIGYCVLLRIVFRGPAVYVEDTKSEKPIGSTWIATITKLWFYKNGAYTFPPNDPTYRRRYGSLIDTFVGTKRWFCFVEFLIVVLVGIVSIWEITNDAICVTKVGLLLLLCLVRMGCVIRFRPFRTGQKHIMYLFCEGFKSFGLFCGVVGFLIGGTSGNRKGEMLLECGKVFVLMSSVIRGIGLLLKLRQDSQAAAEEQQQDAEKDDDEKHELQDISTVNVGSKESNASSAAALPDWEVPLNNVGLGKGVGSVDGTFTSGVSVKAEQQQQHSGSGKVQRSSTVVNQKNKNGIHGSSSGAKSNAPID